MPTYEYACTSCGHRLEAVQRFTDDPLTACPECDSPLRKVYGAVGIVLKGSGFYKTDSRAASRAASGSNGSGKNGADGSSSETAATESTSKKESTSDKGGSDKSGSDKGSSDKSGSDKGSSRKDTTPASSTAS